MRLGLLPRHTWRWWFLNWTGGTFYAPKRRRIPQFRPLQFSRIGQGVDWYFRFGPVTLTRYAACSCPRGN